ncbi:Alg9-like mannosyltransferase [Meredithblackwellia eburnea MCA 4105]
MAEEPKQLGNFKTANFEESFSLHAIHDILAKGFKTTAIQSFDHVQFPGAVPRSFIPALVTSTITYPVLKLLQAASIPLTGFNVQIIIRLVLAILNCSALIFLKRRVKHAFGKKIARNFILLSVTQFHIMFYSSRTLPNMMALPLVLISLGILISPWPRLVFSSNVEVLEAFATLTLAAVILRLEIAAFIIPLALDCLVRKVVGLRELVGVGLGMGVVALGLTVVVDSYFWNKWVWPEGMGLFFNVVEGHSAEWGTSPFHTYFTKLLPKLLHLSLPLAGFSMLIDRRSRRIGIPSIIFVTMMSCLGHKEWRFVVYVVPAFNVCSAAGLEGVRFMYGKSTYRLAKVATISLNVFLSVLTIYASIYNYPGGEAARALGQIATGTEGPKTVHVDSHSAMTGFSRFLHPNEVSPPWFITPTINEWSFNKSETLTIPQDYEKFDYLVTSDPEFHRRTFGRVVGEGFGEFAGFGIGGKWGVYPRVRESVWILEKR